MWFLTASPGWLCLHVQKDIPMLGHYIWYPQLQTSHNRHLCYEHPLTIRGFISHHPMGLRTGLDSDVCSSSSIRASAEGSWGPRGQHSILSSRWRWRSESRVHCSCFSRLGVLSLPEVYQSRSLAKLNAKKRGSTLLFFSGRNCKVRERGHWRTWKIGAANSSAAVTHLRASCPLGAESLLRTAGVRKVADSTLLYIRTCFTGVTWHTLKPGYPLSCSSSCVSPCISLK